MSKNWRKLMFIGLLVFASLPLTAQSTKKPKPNKRPAAKPAAPIVAATPLPTPEAEPPAKRNERPTFEPANDAQKSAAPTLSGPVYFYVFTRPGFTYSRLAIEHDEAGKGQISFQKTSFDEPIVDPVELSAATMTKIRETVVALNFLDSTEEYQYSRDYSHMGNIEFRVKRDGRSREVKFNWTENKNAKFLMDEYRRISNEYTWRFEIISARQNQPLLTPGLMDAVNDYYRRSEISDPPHLVPFLTELSNDERLPLMARNRALKLVKEIEKQKR